MKIHYRLVICFFYIFINNVMLAQSARNNSYIGEQDYSLDSFYCISVAWYRYGHVEPVDAILPVHNQCSLNLSNLNSLKASIQETAYPILTFDSYLTLMISIAYPDSLRSKMYDINFRKLLEYNLSVSEDSDLSIDYFNQIGDSFRIWISMIIGLVKWNLEDQIPIKNPGRNKYPIIFSEIKEIIPLYLDWHMDSTETIIVSEKTLRRTSIDYKKKTSSNQ